jgi:ethylbenzene hydroxylase subunit beta/complex iron-sulfur molybdoenzyme family reductase subunit beta
MNNTGRLVSGKVQKPKRQLAMVFDLNKCIGCNTCTIACKTQWTREEGMESMWWTITNTMPGAGTPKNWEQSGGGFSANDKMRPGKMPTGEDFGHAWEFNYNEVFNEGKGQSVHLKPKGDPKWGPNWDEDQGGGEYPNSYYFYLPRLCNHCDHPACVEACPRKAIEKREQDGVVLINEKRCKGYRFCMEACPYKRIFFNYGKDVAQKCIFCYPRLEKGVAPACARQCPGRMRHIGYLDDENSSVHKLVKKWKIALPLHGEYGTGPNVYYIPPMSPPRTGADGNPDHSAPRIPTEYLESLFGPRVSEVLDTLKGEMDKRRRGEDSEIMRTLIVYKWPEDIFPDFANEPADLVPVKEIR